MNNDLISRSALLKDLKEQHDYIMQDPEVGKNMKWCEAVCFNRTVEAVDSAPAVDAGPTWISVEERLPERKRENFSEYLVVVVRSHWPTSSYDPVDSPYSEEYATVAMYDSEQKLWHLGRSEVVLNALLAADDAPLNGEYVTHWMPLPEPPEVPHG